MAQMFAEEAALPDNRVRSNFVFMGYPFTPPLPADDYGAVVEELEEALPIRFWYFLDEVTSDELMRKVWRAILHADLAIFDISRGNPNVAFELGLAVAKGKRCMTLLKTGEQNPLGTADLGYSERVEYTSAATLKEKLTGLAEKTSALKLLKQLSRKITFANVSQDQMYAHIIALVLKVFKERRVTRAGGLAVLGDVGLWNVVAPALREAGVFELEGEKRGAHYVFGDAWAYRDHEVTGE